MVNLYQLLNLPPHADTAMIQAVLQHAQATGSLEPKVIRAVQEWLLKPDVRARYDAKLRQEQPEFFAASPQHTHNIPTPDISVFAVSETPPAPKQVVSATPPTPANNAPSTRRKKTPVKQAIAEKYGQGQSSQAHKRPKQTVGLIIMACLIIIVIAIAIALFLPFM